MLSSVDSVVVGLLETCCDAVELVDLVGSFDPADVDWFEVSGEVDWSGEALGVLLGEDCSFEDGADEDGLSSKHRTDRPSRRG